MILTNGKFVGFDYLLGEGDEVSVYPVFESLDISPIVRLRPQPLRKTKFILDVHLGKLSKLLRMLGFDSVYQNNLSDPEIVDIALKEKKNYFNAGQGNPQNQKSYPWILRQVNQSQKTGRRSVENVQNAIKFTGKAPITIK